MRPILKWTGGKTSEIEMIKAYEPKEIKRYIEPFLGGGAIFFNKENKNSLVNDFNKELISFYKLIKNEDYEYFKERILIAAKERSEVFELSITSLSFEDLFIAYKDMSTHKYFEKYLKRELISKSKTISRINDKNKKDGIDCLTEEEEINQYKTGAMAALYYAYREEYNDNNLKKSYNKDHIFTWFIMRELAYSGMFRFSKSGVFNVPYGGMSYNTKDLLTKIARIENTANKDFYINAEFNNGDFEVFFEKYNFFDKGDFIFLDPPYDSEFSQYNVEEDFDRNDQIRLRDVLKKTEANIMVVIKETEFIREIYEKDFYIYDFDKNYSVNFRNRNKRSVNHLVITNYKVDV